MKYMITDNIAGVVGNVVAAIFVAVAISTLQSCEPDSWDKVYEPEEQVLQAGNTEYVVNVTGMTEEEHGTRSVLGAETEETPFIKDSGYQVFAFNRRTGVLEAMELVDSHSSSATLSLSAVDTYDFFVVGNLWFLDENGNKAGWDSFFTETDKYPAKAEDMTDASLMPYYRFDGASIGGTGLRTETFAEVAEYGIPFSGRVEGVNYQNSRNGISVSVRRLFSKVTLTVDHSGLVNSEIEEAFVNRSIHLRQVNCRIHPFIEGLAAVAEDILESAEDYESNPVNGMSETFVFYVPENCGGTYPVSDPSQKEPSAAGNRSGCVTYLEFVGELDPVKAGGYGGTLKYQFCLGGNATTDYNVVRNNNYKVELGFRAGSLFDAAYWKLDMGSGLTDTRVLGLSADAAGAQRLAEDGTQVIAVRPANGASKKKELYLFFNHNGGTSNEAASYVDEYTSGYSPADATRSALQISCPDMSADVIKYSYEPSTGRISFWTDSPTALTPGHEYTVTFKLLPGDRTVSAKIRTVADMGVSADFSNYYIGMKRSLTATGFCGSNVSLKVKSGGNDILRYANTEGTDKYITSSGIQLTGTTVPVYAYKNGSLTLAVTSDDTFNDTGADFDITVVKPVPYYGDIPHNVPIAVPDGSKLFADAIHLPLDGTPVDIPVYYRDASGGRINVGDGAGDFDKAVFAQVLSFTGDMRSDDYYGMDDDFKFFCRKIYDDNHKFFGQYVDAPVSVTGMRLRLSFSRIYPKNTTIFNEESDKKDVYFCTFSPGFFDSDRHPYGWDKSEVESDYFNTWSSDWTAWKTYDAIDLDVINAQWPTISNGIYFNLMGCAKSSMTYAGKGDHDSSMSTVNEFVKVSASGEGNNLSVGWEYAPGKHTDGIVDTKGALAPYGKQKILVTLKNIHSEETVTLYSPNFTLKYTNVKLSSYLFCFNGEEYADYFVAAPTVLAWIMHERKRVEPEFDPTTQTLGGIPMPLEAVSDEYVVCDVPNELNANYSTTGYIGYSNEDGTTWAELHAKFTAWKFNGGVPAEVGNYNDATWNADLAAYCYNSLYALPKRYAFKKGTVRSNDIPSGWYSNENLYEYVKFTFDNRGTEGELTCKGYNVY